MGMEGTFGSGQNLCFAILDVIERILGIQVHAEPAGGVHVAHLLVEVQVDSSLMISMRFELTWGVPSASSTCLKRENTPIPGPMADCAKSTGAMLLSCSFFRAGRNSRRRMLMRLRRVVWGASSGRLRQTSTMEEARAFVPWAIVLTLLSVRMGHVPVMAKPAFTTALSIVSPAGRSCAVTVRITLLVSIVDGHWDVLPSVEVHLLAADSIPFSKNSLACSTLPSCR